MNDDILELIKQFIIYFEQIDGEVKNDNSSTSSTSE